MCMAVQCVSLYQPRGFLEPACEFYEETVRFFLASRIPQDEVALHVYHHKHQRGTPRGLQ